jgi:hypothetical protein
MEVHVRISKQFPSTTIELSVSTEELVLIKNSVDHYFYYLDHCVENRDGWSD